jgi:hypothetical protein
LSVLGIKKNPKKAAGAHALEQAALPQRGCVTLKRSPETLRQHGPAFRQPRR